MNRRRFLQQAGCVLAGTACAGAAFGQKPTVTLTGEIGITTGTFSKHLNPTSGGPGRTLLDLPRLMREELDLKVIDLMTASFPSLAPDYLDRLRAAADAAGCHLSNLKMNQPGFDLANPDERIRHQAIDEYKRTMTAAARLGVRWVRPISGRAKGASFKPIALAYRALIKHGAPLGITLLIENVGWIKGDTEAIPAIIKEVGPGLRAQPDIGNWDDAVRYEGLAKAFPLAASCDFKAFALQAEGHHAAYDLRRCFQIGWDAGFRGPWCIEHFNDDFVVLLKELKVLRDLLRGWIKTGGR